MRIVPASKFPAKLPINDDDIFNFRTAAPFPRENRRRVGKKEEKEKRKKYQKFRPIPRFQITNYERTKDKREDWNRRKNIPENERFLGQLKGVAVI